MVFVYRYDYRRGAINVTAHERTHTGRVHFSVTQKLYREILALGVYVYFFHVGRSFLPGHFKSSVQAEKIVGTIALRYLEYFDVSFYYLL